MIDFIVEIVGGLAELVAELAIDLLIEPWIGKLWRKRKHKKRSKEI